MDRFFIARAAVNHDGEAATSMDPKRRWVVHAVRDRAFLLFPGTVGQVAQFQCRLFLLVQAVICGDLAGR